MTPEQFAYWLQGFAELTPQAPTGEQWQCIRDHLNLVFKKETPPVQFRVKDAVPDHLQEAIRRHNEEQERERRKRIIDPPSVDPSYWHKPPVITC